MLEEELLAPVQTAVRALATAARSLRLYPATSPIPLQTVEAAVAPLDECLRDRAALVLAVARDGFTCQGTPVGGTEGGAADLADVLRAQGVAEIAFLSGVSADELLGLLTVVMREPAEVHEAGGVPAALVEAGVVNVRVVAVSLVVTPQVDEPAEGEDVDDFFRELAFDSEKLATWLAAATHADTFTLSAGLGELADAVGADGLFRFFESFAQAFVAQDGDGKDALLGLGLEPGSIRDLIGGMLGNLPTPEISAPLAGGLYGRNMLSLSTALARLPLGQRMDEVIAEVRAALPENGHGERELEFLDHMVEVRTSGSVESAVLDADPTYHQVLDASRVDPAMFEMSRAEAARAVARIDGRSVTTMLALLDQQRDFTLYARSLDNLAAMVPRLFQQGDIGLAVTVLEEIAERESHTTQPWPELTNRLRAALSAATSRGAMRALLETLVREPGLIDGARDVMRLADDASKVAFVEEALGGDSDDALRIAEALLGNRMVDMLATAAPRVPARQVGRLVRVLASREDARTLQALDAIVMRPDEAVRTAAAEALGGSRSPAAPRLLAQLLRDPAPQVASAAARALSRSDLPDAAPALAARLGELDVDGRDFAVGREIIVALSQMPDPSAADALRRLAERKQILKRGRFVEVQQLAREALAAQSLKVAR